MINEIKQVLKSFNKNDIIFTTIFATVLIVTQILAKSNVISLVACVLGIIYVMLTKKRSRFCSVFGFLQIVLYIYISFESKFYGDFALNVFNLMLQPVIFYFWSKSSKQGKVEINRLTQTGLSLTFSIWLSLIVMSWFPLRILGGNTPFIDATITISSIVAILLNVWAFHETWVFWIITNIASIILWTLALFRGDSSSLPMLIMFVAYFINSVDAYKQWNKA